MSWNLPWFLEYFVKDILWNDSIYKVKKMFSWYGIFKNKKIFALYINDELYFRENIFNKNEKQFSYKRLWKEIFLPYFWLDESIVENFEELEKYINSSLDY